jgi:hypothetical protein
MASDKYKVFEGTASTIEVTVKENTLDYTPPSGRMFIIRAVAFHNGNSSAQKAYLKAGTTNIISKQVESMTSAIIDCYNAILLSGEKLYVKGEVANDITFRIWGVEIDN